MQVFRFNFRPPFAKLVESFSRAHLQTRSLQAFQEAFAEWERDSVAEAWRDEKAYLESVGFRGDFQDKVFKSARYYFRHKGKRNQPHTVPASTDEPEQPRFKPSRMPRKKYSSLHPSLVCQMTDFLSMDENRVGKPSHAFATFCQRFSKHVLAEIQRLQASDPTAKEKIHALLKIKKTFKNKHFIIKKQCSHPTHPPPPTALLPTS